MTHNEKIAIVILNYNGARLFDTFLPSVLRNSNVDNTEVYVADNGSTDDSVTVLKNQFPAVRLIELKNNFGFAEGYNLALSQIEAGIFVLLNSDVEVTPGWLEKCVRLLQNDDSVAAVQPKILNFNKPHLFEYAGAAGGFIDKFGYPFCRGRILNRMEPDLGQYNRISPIFWASGACMFVKSEIFRNAGGFDGDFWAHMEEIDLCWRIKSLGYQVLYQPESVVFHLGGGTLSYGSPRKIYLNFRNNLYMLFKNLPENQFKRIFLTRMVLDGVAAVKFIAGLHVKEFWAVCKAHFSFYENLRVLIRKRREVRKRARINDHREIYPKSIMWKFFLQNKHQFHELNFNPVNDPSGTISE